MAHDIEQLDSDLNWIAMHLLESEKAPAGVKSAARRVLDALEDGVISLTSVPTQSRCCFQGFETEECGRRAVAGGMCSDHRGQVERHEEKRPNAAHRLG